MRSVTDCAALRIAHGIWNGNRQQEVDDRRSRQRAEATKTGRLRELRLAKEAADRKIAERRGAEESDVQRGRPRRKLAR